MSTFTNDNPPMSLEASDNAHPEEKAKMEDAAMEEDNKVAEDAVLTKKENAASPEKDAADTTATAANTVGDSVGTQQGKAEEESTTGTGTTPMETEPTPEQVTETPPAVSAPLPPVVEDDDNDDDVWEAASKKRSKQQSSKRKKKKPKITISLMQNLPETTAPEKEEDAKEVEPESSTDPTLAFRNDLEASFHQHQQQHHYQQERGGREEEYDWVSFFEESHEEQDVTYYQAWQRQEKARRIKLQLEDLEKSNQAGQQEIEQVIHQQTQQKQRQTAANLKKYQTRATEEEKRDMQRLQLLYRNKTASNQQKISQSLKVLQQRQQKEISAAMQHHRQQQQQQPHRQMPDWQQTLQQLQTKHSRQMKEFANKGEEINRKTDHDYKREQEKIRKTLQQRLNEVESNRQKMTQKLLAGYAQLKQRYLKRHYSQIVKQRNAILEQAKKEVQGDLEKVIEQQQQAETTSSTRERVQKALEEKQELQPPAAMVSKQDWIDLQRSSQAAARHQHRKSVLAQTQRQVALEIHNEGIWMAVIVTTPVAEEDNSKKEKPAPVETLENLEFLPWSLQAWHLLEAVVCGEVPTQWSPSASGMISCSTNNFSLDLLQQQVLQAQGGQLRCLLTDLRTCEETASAQRVSALQSCEEAQLAEWEAKVTDLATAQTTAEKAASDEEAQEREAQQAADASQKEVAKAKRMQEEFINKFRNFIGPDGAPIPTANAKDRQELLKAMMRYKTNVENATQRDKKAKATLAETKVRIQKLQADAKAAMRNAQLASNLLKKRKAMLLSARTKTGRPARQSEAAEMERASTRVKDVIAGLKLTAEKRRQQALLRKSNSNSTAFAQSFPGIPTTLKKSLWHRMHRRKQQMILRPTPEMLMNELRDHVAQAVVAKQQEQQQQQQQQQGNKSGSGSSAAAQKKFSLLLSVEDEQVRAEQLYLLATHPLAEKELAAAPNNALTVDTAWAEPGWQLLLNVPTEQDGDAILPCAPSFDVLERNLAEMVSAPGRQAATLVRPSDLRSLSAPLSAFAIASSPAETKSTTVSSQATPLDGDPMYISDEIMKIGYSFTLRTQVPKASTQNRKKVTAATAKEQQQRRPSLSGAEASESTLKASPASLETSSTAATTPSQKKRRNSKSAVPPIPAQAAATAAAQYSQYLQQQQQQSHAPPSSSSSAPQMQLAAQQTQHKPQHKPQHQPQHQLQHPPQHSTQHPPQSSPSQQQRPQQQPLQSQQQQSQQQLSQQQQSQQQQQSATQYSRQMAAQAHLRLMQQQQQQQNASSSSPRQPAAVGNTFSPQMQQLQQFYSPLNHPNTAVGRLSMHHLQGHRTAGVVPSPPQQQQHGQQQHNTNVMPGSGKPQGGHGGQEK